MSRGESHISATSHVSNAEVGYTPQVSSTDEDYETHLQRKGRYQEDSYSHAAEAEYEVTRYRSGHEGMGSSQAQSNPSQRYAGQCNEGGSTKGTI